MPSTTGANATSWKGHFIGSRGGSDGDRHWRGRSSFDGGCHRIGGSRKGDGGLSSGRGSNRRRVHPSLAAVSLCSCISVELVVDTQTGGGWFSTLFFRLLALRALRCAIGLLLLLVLGQQLFHHRICVGLFLGSLHLRSPVEAVRWRPCLGKVWRPTFAVAVHAVEHGLRTGVALRCSEPVQPPRLCKVWRPTFAVVVHVAELGLRIGLALRCSQPKQPPRLYQVFRSAVALVVHSAEPGLRIGVALHCSEPKLAPDGLSTCRHVDCSKSGPPS